MRSTGEVMGVGDNFGEAFAKAQLSAGSPLPEKGTVFISVNDRYKPDVVADREALCGSGIRSGGDAGYGGIAAKRRAEVQGCVQSERRTAERSGSSERRVRFNW